MLRILSLSILSLVAVLGGCAAKGPLLLEKQLGEISVGVTSSTEVLDKLDHEGILHSANSVSVLSEKGWAKELAIVQFGNEDSKVGRTLYIKMRSRRELLSTKESLQLVVTTEISDSILDEPYDNAMRQQVAILEEIHKLVVADARPFMEDQATASLVGLARSALATGIETLKSHPRRAGQLESKTGFAYEHMSLGKSGLFLTRDSETIYTVNLDASDRVDLVDSW